MWNMNARNGKIHHAKGQIRGLITGAFVAAACVSAACTDTAVGKAKAEASAAIDATTAGADKVLDATKKASEKTLDATKDAAATTAEKAKDVAGDVAADVADKSKELASSAGEAVTDTWITAKVKAKFADEKLLNGADIKVETNNHLVTLTGTVPSSAAQARAVEIAQGTERVTRVVNKLVIART